MKKRLLFYSIATLAVIALIVGVISSTTKRHLTQTGDTTSVEQIAIPVTSTEISTTVKKKACGCCAERIARLQEQIRKARERRLAKQDAQATGFEAQQTSERASNSP